MIAVLAVAPPSKRYKKTRARASARLGDRRKGDGYGRTLAAEERDKAEDDRSQHEAEEHVSDGSTQGQGRAAVGMSLGVEDAGSGDADGRARAPSADREVGPARRARR